MDPTSPHTPGTVQAYRWTENAGQKTTTRWAILTQPYDKEHPLDIDLGSKYNMPSGGNLDYKNKLQQCINGDLIRVETDTANLHPIQARSASEELSYFCQLSMS